MKFINNPLPPPRTTMTDTNGILNRPWQVGFAALQSNQDILQFVFRGAGNPNGVVSAQTGSIYLNSSGGANTTIWVKESSPTPSTGWIAK